MKMKEQIMKEQNDYEMNLGEMNEQIMEMILVRK